MVYFNELHKLQLFDYLISKSLIKVKVQHTQCWAACDRGCRKL